MSELFPDADGYFAPDEKAEYFRQKQKDDELEKMSLQNQYLIERGLNPKIQLRTKNGLDRNFFPDNYVEWLEQKIKENRK